MLFFSILVVLTLTPWPGQVITEDIDNALHFSSVCSPNFLERHFNAAWAPPETFGSGNLMISPLSSSAIGGDATTPLNLV